VRGPALENGADGLAGADLPPGRDAIVRHFLEILVPEVVNALRVPLVSPGSDRQSPAMRFKPWLLGAVLVALSAIAALRWHGRSNATPAPTTAAAALNAPINVEVYPLAPEALEVQVPATGTLLARESVEIVSELSRRLVRVRAEEGRFVRAGDVLFELDASDLRAELNKAAVQARMARVTLERTQKLASEGLSNQQELDLAQGRADELVAERELLEVTLAKTQIRAPFAGRLGLRRVSEGAWLSSNTVLTTLQDVSSLKLDFTLPERYAGTVSQGGAFRFRVEGKGELYSGKISALEPSVDVATRSLRVRGVVEGHAGLMPGAAASIEVPLRVEQALLVPSLALVPGVDGRRVFLADQGVTRSVLVEVGLRVGDRAQILSGLSAGDQIIVTNLLRVREGAPVAVQTGSGRP
jgi:membrane fusion protein (multidrug efflux system)